MDLVIGEIIQSWGLLGAILIGFGWLIYDNWKSNKNRKSDSDSIKKHMTEQVGIMDKKLDLVDKKIDFVESNLNDRMDTISDRVDHLPANNVAAIQRQKADDDAQHLKHIEDLMLLGGHIHTTLKKYTKIINADHIFIGSFHNGNSNLSGIPFCKFDIISECYADDKVPHDHEFAPVYKDSDILRYGSLFSALSQNDHIHLWVLPDEDNNEMAQYEDIIWRRMYGLGIKQIMVKILRDPDGVPSGFVGVVRYDKDDMDMDSVIQCGQELELIYSNNKYKKNNVDKK